MRDFFAAVVAANCLPASFDTTPAFFGAFATFFLAVFFTAGFAAATFLTAFFFAGAAFFTAAFLATFFGAAVPADAATACFFATFFFGATFAVPLAALICRFAAFK